MTKLLNNWKLAIPQKELDEIWMIHMEIKNHETLGVCPLLLQMTHNALFVVNVTISSINALIMSAKDVIKEILVTTKSSVSSNYDKHNEPGSIIQTCSEMSHFSLSSLVSLQPEDDSWNIFSPRP